MLYQFDATLGRFDSLVEYNQKDDKRGLLVAMLANLEVLEGIAKEAQATIDRYQRTREMLRFCIGDLKDMIELEESQAQEAGE